MSSVQLSYLTISCINANNNLSQLKNNMQDLSNNIININSLINDLQNKLQINFDDISGYYDRLIDISNNL
jgi:hypothetical protein